MGIARRNPQCRFSDSMMFGHTRQLAYLEKVAAGGMLGHAYLFEGPKRVGKMTAALEWTSSFFPVSERALVAAGTHPDAIICSVERHLAEKLRENENVIGIDDIRELRRLMALSVSADSRRVAIVDGAEDMSGEAQNALLKILEEPGERKLFILVSHDASRLFSTILSRVISLSFSYLSDDAMRRFAKELGVSGRDEDDFLFCAGGRPGILARLARDPEFRAVFLKQKETLALLRDAPLFERMAMVVGMAGDRDAEEEFFFGLFRMARKRLLQALECGGGRMECAPLRNALRIKGYMDTTNVNRRLALENMVLEM